MFKKIAAVAVAMTMSAAGLALAEVSEELTMKEVQARRTEIVLENLPMSAEQRTAFDPVYEAYRTEVVKLNERLIGLIETFAKEIDTASDDRIDTIIREANSIRDGRVEARKANIDAFENAIGVRRTFRLYQIENKLNAIVAIQIAAIVPLIPVD